MTEDEIRLIRKVAWKYALSFPSLEFDDLFHEGVIAYLTARDKFDPSRGKLSTFIFRVVSSYYNTIYRVQQRRLPNISIESAIHALSSLPSEEHEHDPDADDWLTRAAAKLSDEALLLCKAVLRGDVEVERAKPKANRRRLRRYMERLGIEDRKSVV